MKAECEGNRKTWLLEALCSRPVAAGMLMNAHRLAVMRRSYLSSGRAFVNDCQKA